MFLKNLLSKKRDPDADMKAVLGSEGITLGYDVDTGESIVVPWCEWGRHGLTLGGSGVGKVTFREWVFFQQLAKGGGVLWVGHDRYDLNHLVEICERTGRHDDLLVIDLGNPEWAKEYSHVDLFEAIRSNRILCFVLPSMQNGADKAKFGEVLITDFRDAVIQLQGRIEEQSRVPFILWAEHFGNFLPVTLDLAARLSLEDVGTLFSLCRAANIAVMLEETTFAALNAIGLSEVVINNTATKIVFQVFEKSTGQKVAELIGESSGPPERRRADFAHTLTTLNIGEAFVISGKGENAKTRRIRIPKKGVTC